MVATVAVELGIHYPNYDCTMVTAAAFVKGDVVAVGAFVSDLGVLNTVEEVATADLEFGLMAVCLADVASGAEGEFRFRGIVDALIVGTPAINAGLAGTNAAQGLTAVAANQKCIARPLRVGVDGVVSSVMFNGIEGMGHNET